jgi:hypothetical protein
MNLKGELRQGEGGIAGEIEPRLRSRRTIWRVARGQWVSLSFPEARRRPQAT